MPNFKTPSRSKKRFSSNSSGLGTLMGFMAGRESNKNLGNTISQVSSEIGQASPGTSINIAPRGASVSIPSNRILDTEERGDIALINSLEPTVQSIEDKIFEGRFGTSPFERTKRQMIIDSGESLFSSMDKGLQEIQSDFNHLKSQLPFTSGGKQLSPTEKELVFKLLITRGKSDEIVLRDLRRAMSIVRNKEKLITGGSNLVNELKSTRIGGSPEGGNDNRSKIQSIKDRFTKRVP